MGNAIMMLISTLFCTLSLFVTCSLGTTPGANEELVRSDRIKVFLYAAPAFWQEVAVDALKDTCTDLDNNLIDGMVQSILIGGRDVLGVLARTDNWYCTFYDNYDCEGDTADTLTVGDGVNNLASSNWTGIHALKCSIENEWWSEYAYS
jgi:hypothetical protein